MNATQDPRMKLHLPATLAAWTSPHFVTVFKREFEALSAGVLPLQQALAHSSAVADEAFQAILIASEANAESLVLKVGVMYEGIIAGCNCADDPSPPATQTEYCVLILRIDRVGAAASVALDTDSL